MTAEELVVHGAREHNLKDVTVRIPRSALVCITGLSGSGKSSLAFDTIYAEGQRRYVESLSAYARQFLQMMEKPDVDSIDGPSPAISIGDDVAQPALDGRHGDRDLRLPQAPVRAHRAAALPDLRAADRRAVPRPDRRAGAPPRGGDALHRERPGRPGPQGRVQGRARGAPSRRVHAREGGRRAAPARGGRSSSTRSSSTRSRSSSTAS